MKPIITFQDKFSITEDGRIFNHIKNKPVKCQLIPQGYLKVTLNYKGKRYDRLVHRLVAETYLHNWNEKLEVHHIDNNSLNNHYLNLRMTTRTQNLRGKVKSKYKYRGISFQRNKWAAFVGHKCKNIYAGAYETQEEAGFAWNIFAEFLGYPKDSLNEIKNSALIWDKLKNNPVFKKAYNKLISNYS